MNKAYVDTTVLTDVLVKPGSKKEATAKAALSRYAETLLPVYSIKEWKKGPLDHYAYVHDKLVQTKSVADTLAAINSISPYYAPYKKFTSSSAIEAAFRLNAAHNGDDTELADRLRLQLASLIVRSWQKRRLVTTRTIQDLECYTEAEPTIGRDGYINLMPQKCQQDRECCLADALKARPDLLKALRDAIPASSTRDEDRNRRKVLKQLINTPKVHLTEEQCRWLGDALFAFFCPHDAAILTTNVRDHKPLAEAIGKTVEQP
jgi:hypothetical protein